MSIRENLKKVGAIAVYPLTALAATATSYLFVHSVYGAVSADSYGYGQLLTGNYPVVQEAMRQGAGIGLAVITASIMIPLLILAYKDNNPNPQSKTL